MKGINMRMDKYIFTIVCLLSFANAEQPLPILLSGKLGFEYSYNENITKTHNNHFLPTYSLGVELPIFNFAHIYLNYGYTSKMGHPYVTPVQIDSDGNIIYEESYIAKDQSYLIEKNFILTGIKKEINLIRNYSIGVGLGIMPHFKAKYVKKDEDGNIKMKLTEKGFAGYVYNFDISRNISEKLIIRFSMDYMHISDKISNYSRTKDGLLYSIQIGYNLKIKTPNHSSEPTP